jgi:integration host factor subunit beta
MDKLQFIKRIAEKHPQLNKKDAEHTVQVILDVLCGVMAKGGRIEIRGFGSFSLNLLPPKQKRNPKTGFTFKEPPKYIPHFRPAKELRARLSNANEAGSAEICAEQQISPDMLDHDAANDTEQTAIYA